MIGLELNEERQLSLIRKSNREPGPKDVIVKVLASGICGTDNHIIRGESRVSLPVILGHEFGGTVFRVGPEVTNVSTGDLVAVDPNIVCHICENCRDGNIHLCRNLTAIGVDRDGGMSDICIIPATQAYRVPDGFDPRYLPFVEPLSCVLHGLERISVKHGEKALIIGAGTIGLMHLLLLRDIAGFIAIDEVNGKRLSKALSLGARELTEEATGGFDAVLECSGTVEGFRKAMTSVKPGGRILVFGVTPIGKMAEVSPNDVYRRELTVVGSYLNPNTFNRSIALIASGRIALSSLDVKSFGLERFREAFEASASGEFSKVAFQSAEVD
jgi:L-iditol 2-dehydrogenase